MSKLQKFICLFLLSASLAITGMTVKHSKSQPAIVIGYSNSPAWWPWAIAESENLFAKRGLNVELKWYEDYSDSVVDLVTGRLDANSQKLSDTVFFRSSAVNGEVGILLNSNSARNDKLIVSQKIKTFEDLEGKTVVVDSDYSDNELLKNVLKDANLTVLDINLIKADFGEAPSYFALGHNNIDAVIVSIPNYKIALKLDGAREIASSQDYSDTVSDVLVTTEKLVNNYPEQAQSITDTWFDVLAFMENHPQRADQIIAKRAGVTVKELQSLNLHEHLAARAENIKACQLPDPDCLGAIQGGLVKPS